VAEYLGWPQATDVVQCELSDEKKAVVHSERDGGHAVLEVELPAVLTTQKGLNEPRYASLKGIMKAKKKKIEKKSLADLGLTNDDVAAKTKTVKLALPPATEKSLRLFEGDAPTQAKATVQALTEEFKII
jgi:electron transfer flavoprotein beta subunit